ncbi:MAG: hypothetical protein M3Q08_10235 [Pseudomonadota bacterium]|nr:hypothetical protein [Pseudomonadota bacterium]
MAVTAACSPGEDKIPDPSWQFLYNAGNNEPFFVDRNSLADRDGAKTVWVRFGNDIAGAENWAYRCADWAYAEVNNVEKMQFAPIPPGSIAADVYGGVCGGKWPSAPPGGFAAPSAPDLATTNDVTAIDSGPSLVDETLTK